MLGIRFRCFYPALHHMIAYRISGHIIPITWRGSLSGLETGEYKVILQRLLYWSKFWQKLIFRQSFRLNSFGRYFAGGFHMEVFVLVFRASLRRIQSAILANYEPNFDDNG